MKLIKILPIIISLFMVAPQFANSLTETLNQVASELTAKFKEKQQVGDFKFGLGIGVIDNNSKEAKDNKIGAAIRQLLMDRLSESTIFTVVDRNLTGKILKEIELRQQGVVEGQTEIAELKAIDFILRGAVSDIAENFSISLQLISVAKGEQVAFASINIPKGILIERAHLARIEYVTQHAIGLTIDYNRYTGKGTNNAGYEQANVLLNYRLGLSWLTSFGVSVPFRQLNQVLYNFGKDGEKVKATNVMNELDNFNNDGQGGGANSHVFIDNGGIDIAGPGANGSYTDMQGLYRKRFNAAGLMVKQFYIWNINRYFNIGFGLGGSIFFNPSIEQDYDIIPRRLSRDHAVIDRAVITVYANRPIVVVKFEIRPELFITPRLTLRLYGGYAQGSPFQPKNARYKDSVILSKETNSQKKDERFFELFGLNPFVDPVTEGRVAVDFSGVFYGAGLGFWF